MEIPEFILLDDTAFPPELKQAAREIVDTQYKRGNIHAQGKIHIFLATQCRTRIEEDMLIFLINQEIEKRNGH